MVTEFHHNFLIKNQVAKQPKLSASSPIRFSSKFRESLLTARKGDTKQGQNRHDTPKLTNTLVVLCELERDGEIPH